MRGKVKWFSEEKGYGFIVDESGQDHHFHVSAVKGADVPRGGRTVSFDPERGRKGPRAVNVLPLDHSPSRPPSESNAQRIDDRVTCTSCERRMIPRIITGPPLVHGKGSWTPVPKRSLCPYCGATFRKFPPSTGEKVGLVIFLVVFFLIFAGLAFGGSSHSAVH